MIGYYVHHHGEGHRARFEKICGASGVPMTALSQLPIEGGVLLPGDVVDGAQDHTAGGSLHWAPTGHPTLGRRAKAICDWVVAADPMGVVVDVSVEATLLLRLAGVHTVVVRQHGNRIDEAHVAAYSSARRLLAPFPTELEHAGTPEWVVAKTDYAGFVSLDVRATATTADAPACGFDGPRPGRDDVVVLWGRGGGELSALDLTSIAEAVSPGRVWCVGHVPAARMIEPSNVVDLGWRTDVAVLLEAGPTVVASAGNNVVAEAAGAACALVVVPQVRPFDEQLRHAESLDRARVAAVRCDSTGSEPWADTIATARHRRRALAQLAMSGGAAAAACHIVSAFAD